MKKIKLIEFFSPLSIQVGKRNYILNLNNYRNWHYRVSNFIKINYKKFMREQIVKIKKQLKKIEITYTVFRKDKRRFDIGNVCSVHQKFFEDAIVEYGLIPDDKASCIVATHFLYGGVDKNNSCVKIEVKELDND